MSELTDEQKGAMVAARMKAFWEAMRTVDRKDAAALGPDVRHSAAIYAALNFAACALVGTMDARVDYGIAAGRMADAAMDAMEAEMHKLQNELN